MLRKLLPRSIYDVMAAIACFGVLAGGTAYAANTVFSSDIVDGEVKSIDIGQNEIGSADVKDNSLNTFDVHSFIGEDVVDGTLTGADVSDNSTLGPLDISEQTLAFNNTLLASDLATASVGTDEVANLSLGNDDFATGSVDSRVATDNSLTATDIDEASLAHCHSGAVLFGRLCAGSNGSTGTLDTAGNSCIGVGLRLPTWGEATQLAINHDVPGVSGSDLFWTDEALDWNPSNPSEPLMVAVQESGGSEVHLATVPAKIVCVEIPTTL
jgi:hypothetical protein